MEKGLGFRVLRHTRDIVKGFLMLFGGRVTKVAAEHASLKPKTLDRKRQK